MASLSLREAAHEVGISKSTILRAIQSGRLLAPRKDDGGYAIDPDELFRVYRPKDPDREPEPDLGPAAAQNGHEKNGHEQNGLERDDAATAEDAAPAELAARMAALEVELRGLKDLVAKVNQPRASWWKRLVG
jgi:excisionase family DNA binding protein